MNKLKSLLTWYVCSFTVLAMASAYSEKKENKENVTTLVYGSQPNDISSYSLIQLEMIPELLSPSPLISTRWPQIPLNIPENHVSLKDFEIFPKLKFLAFNFGSKVAVGDAYLPELETLALYHADLSGLAQLRAPKLRELSLNGGQANSPERLPSSSPHLTELHFYNVSPNAFDYSSLAEYQLEALTLWNCDEDLPLEFLKGLPLKRLSLFVRELSEDKRSILAALPLEELTLRVADRNADFNFLAQLKLRKLNLHMQMSSKIKLEYLKGMPLESLQLLSWSDRNTDWKILETMPLKELVLTKCAMNDSDFLAKLPLESLVLQECYWKDEKILEAISQIGTLKNLFIGTNFYTQGKEHIYINEKFPWDVIRNPELETLVFYGPVNFNFCRNLKKLKNLKFLTVSRQATDISSLNGQSLECLVINDAEKQKNKWKEMDINVKRLLPLQHIFFQNKTPENLLFNTIWWIN